jgi:hypothetical protein
MYIQYVYKILEINKNYIRALRNYYIKDLQVYRNGPLNYSRKSEHFILLKINEKSSRIFNILTISRWIVEDYENWLIDNKWKDKPTITKKVLYKTISETLDASFH